MNKTFEKLLPVPINEQEKLELCEILGKDCVRKAELEQKKKDMAAEYNEKIKMIQEEIDKNSHIAASGEVLKSIRCQATPNYSTKMVEIVRLDYGEIIDTRPMTEEELAQIDMDLGEE